MIMSEKEQALLDLLALEEQKMYRELDRMAGQGSEASPGGVSPVAAGLGLRTGGCRRTERVAKASRRT